MCTPEHHPRPRPGAVALLAFLWLLAPSVARGGGPLLPRPPRLPAASWYFARSVRPLEPRTAVSLGGGLVRGGTVAGVERQLWALWAEGELALGPLGLFVGLPVVRHGVTTEGIYGEGRAGVWDGGELRFGLGALIWQGAAGGVPLRVGAGVRVAAPSGEAPRLTPASPVLSAPPHDLGPARWSAGGGGALGLGPWRGLSVQLDLELWGQFLDQKDLPLRREQWLLSGTALTLAWALAGRLELLAQVQGIFELYGQNPLRQMVFAGGGLRLRLGRFALEAGVRGPLSAEARAEQRLTVGLALSLGLGPQLDGPWRPWSGRRAGRRR